MNVQHKCLFHSNNTIIKFCQNKQCTLPLCLECQPIHINEHSSQGSQGKILRFNEATLKASNEMQDYLQNYKRYVRQQKNRIENDREIVVNMIDQYYNTAYSMMDKLKENADKVEEHFNKLRKGSIKTLIFYYSGDIKIDRLQMEFEPLQNKLRRLLQGKEQRVEMPEMPQKRVERIHQVSSIEQDKKYQSNLSQGSNVQERVKIQKNIENEHQNIFSNIQQIKQGRSRARKSIFDQNNKKGATNSNEPIEVQNKYQEKDLRQDFNSLVQPSPKFHFDPPHTYKFQYQKHMNFQPQAPVSFENRFLTKFTGGQREKQKQSITKYQQVPKIETPYYQTKKYEDFIVNSKIVKHSDQPYAVNTKILKPSDLQIQKENNRQQTYTNTLTQRNRSLSQNHMVDKKLNYDVDLKKQVLSPDQIRKMLQKKIEERNRILSIKKSDNYQPPVEEKPKRSWETRDSIINQIYTDSRQ